MSKAPQAAAIRRRILNDLAYDVNGEPLDPIDIIRAACAAAEVVRAPLDAITQDFAALRTEANKGASVPSAVVSYYAEASQAFAAIVSDYLFSIDGALGQVERALEGGAAPHE